MGQQQLFQLPGARARRERTRLPEQDGRLRDEVHHSCLGRTTVPRRDQLQPGAAARSALQQRSDLRHAEEGQQGLRHALRDRGGADPGHRVHQLHQHEHGRCHAPSQGSGPAEGQRRTTWTARGAVHRGQRHDRHHRHRRCARLVVAMPARVQCDHGKADRHGLPVEGQLRGRGGADRAADRSGGRKLSGLLPLPLRTAVAAEGRCGQRGRTAARKESAHGRTVRHRALHGGRYARGVRPIALVAYQ